MFQSTTQTPLMAVACANIRLVEPSGIGFERHRPDFVILLAILPVAGQLDAPDDLVGGGVDHLDRRLTGFRVASETGDRRTCRPA